MNDYSKINGNGAIGSTIAPADSNDQPSTHQITYNIHIRFAPAAPLAVPIRYGKLLTLTDHPVVPGLPVWLTSGSFNLFL